MTIVRHIFWDRQALNYMHTATDDNIVLNCTTVDSRLFYIVLDSIASQYMVLDSTACTAHSTAEFVEDY